MIQPAQAFDADTSPALPFAALIPEPLVQYRAFIVAAIDFFINRLPPHRREVDRVRPTLPCCHGLCT